MKLGLEGVSSTCSFDFENTISGGWWVSACLHIHQSDFFASLKVVPGVREEDEKVSWDAPFDSSLSQSNVLTFPTICL